MTSFIFPKNYWKLLLLVGFIGWNTDISAKTIHAETSHQAEPVAFTLQTAIRQATQNNLDFKALQAKLGLSDADIITAGARLNPSLLSDNGMAEATYRLGIQQVIELGGQRSKRIAVAQAQKRVMEEEIREGLLKLYAEVRAAYANLYYAQARCAAYERLREQEEKLLLAAKQQLKSQHPEEDVDLMQTEIELLTTENALDQEERQKVEALHHLNAILNLPLDTALALTAPPAFPTESKGDGLTPIPALNTLEKLDPEVLVQKAMERRPDLKRLQAEMAILPHELRLTRAQRIPSLTLAVGPDFVSAPQPQHSVFAMGYLELPVFDRQQGPIQHILAAQTQGHREEEALKAHIRLEVNNAYQSLMASETRLTRYERKLLPLGSHLNEMAKAQFEQGKVSVMLPLTAQSQYTQAILGHLQALWDLQKAVNDLEKALASGV